MTTIATVNVNGIRAAIRKGMEGWLAEAAPDIVTMQEVRAPDQIVRDLVGPEWHLLHSESLAKGRAGVAIASRTPLTAVRIGLGIERFDGQGRWVEADLETPAGAPLTVISAYVHTGNADNEEKMEEKYAFLDAMVARIATLRESRENVVLTGDLNVAHREVDIKNWKGNLKKSGFLPAERAYFDRLFGDEGWTDVHRTLAGEGPGPYTWWSNRGKAFDNDAGWRIDYQVASAALAATARTVRVDRAPSWDTRWSDHAPLVVDYEI